MMTTQKLKKESIQIKMKKIIHKKITRVKQLKDPNQNQNLESIQIKMRKIIHKKITRVKQLKDPNQNQNLTQINKSEKENNEKSTREK